jgi:hypothetical protein
MADIEKINKDTLPELSKQFLEVLKKSRSFQTCIQTS